MTVAAIRPTEPAVSDRIGSDLLTITVYVSRDQEDWYPVSFEGESPAYVDNQAARWLKDRPYLSVQMDEGTTCWASFPETFDAIFASAIHERQLVTIGTR